MRGAPLGKSNPRVWGARAKMSLCCACCGLRVACLFLIRGRGAVVYSYTNVRTINFRRVFGLRVCLGGFLACLDNWVVCHQGCVGVCRGV